jgi:hypothetical protein
MQIQKIPTEFQLDFSIKEIGSVSAGWIHLAQNTGSSGHGNKLNFHKSREFLE